MFSVKARKKSRVFMSKVAVVFLASLFVVILGFSQLGIDVSWAGDHHYKDVSWAGDHHHKHQKEAGFCTQTAQATFIACGYEAKDDYLTAVGNCINVSDRQERKECYIEAEEKLKEANEECRDVREARLEICELVGEERYDPDFDPENFIKDPDFIEGNSYLPLAVGNYWIYEGDGETIMVEVLDATKQIEGVTCRVVRDLVVDEDGKAIEDTDDWYAEHKDSGDVWYVGEISRNYELFEGDNPDDPELVDIDGSWKTGREGAKPGILIEADPQSGHAYRQELLLGDAEDVAEVIHDDYYHGGKYPDLDQFIPEALKALCSKDEPCVVTRDLTALEPDVEELKFYAPGIGVFLEVNPETGEIVQLVECNSDSKCDSLPTP